MAAQAVPCKEAFPVYAGPLLVHRGTARAARLAPVRHPGRSTVRDARQQRSSVASLAAGEHAGGW